jgi:ectoine hydroxylase-related dioxygenase (phytanoyl-CoA dioxygenase family)
VHRTIVCASLVRWQNLAIGPTQLALGTHTRTGDLGRSTVEEQYPDDAYVAAQLGGPGTQLATMDCAPGDVVVMDGRLLHRGLGNDSSEVRPLVYTSFCRPWYREWPRSQNEARSVFE